MNCIVRVARGVFEAARRDLHRPHAFAQERVGFLWGRTASFERSAAIVLLTDFTSVPDEQYVDDATVGARIDGVAIRTALSRVLETGESCFHFHLHMHPGRPRLSCTDGPELRRLIPTFMSAAPTAVHGALIGSVDSASAWAWRRHGPSGEPVGTLALVGFPTDIWTAT